MLGLLAHEWRREVLRYFQQADASVASLGTLADHLVESDATDARDPERATIELHHFHLPKLSETAVVEYDVDTATVRYHVHEDVEALLETVDAIESTSTSDRNQRDPS